METMREAWTDERLDDLNAKVDRGFDRVETEMRSQRHELKAEIAGVREEMNAGFDKVDARFEDTASAADVNARFDKIDARFESTASAAEVNARFDKIDARFERTASAAEVTARFEQVDARFKQVDVRFEQVDARFDKVDERLNRIEDTMEKQFGILAARIDSLNRTLLGFAVAVIIILLTGQLSPF